MLYKSSLSDAQKNLSNLYLLLACIYTDASSSLLGEEVPNFFLCLALPVGFLLHLSTEELVQNFSSSEMSDLGFCTHKFASISVCKKHQGLR